jgi:hypothetical protein
VATPSEKLTAPNGDVGDTISKKLYLYVDTITTEFVYRDTIFFKGPIVNFLPGHPKYQDLA